LDNEIAFPTTLHPPPEAHVRARTLSEDFDACSFVLSLLLPPMEFAELPFPLTTTPPPFKKRKLVPVLPRMNSNDLLASFGAHKSPGSVTKMNREAAGHSLRGQAAMSYAESPPTSADNSPSKSDFDDGRQQEQEEDDEEDEDSEDELGSEDTINGEGVLPIGVLHTR
jgi:hypothetical protein